MPLPLLFAIIGALTGLFVSQAASFLKNTDYTLYLFTLVLVVAVFSFIWQKQSTKSVIKSLLFMMLLLFGLTFWFVDQGYSKTDYFTPFFIIALIQITVICTAFIQSWQPQKPHFVYRDLFENAWNNHFFLIFSGLLTAGFLLVLGLGTSLFESIGFKQISRIIWSKEITPVIVATLVGTGIGISREHDALIFKIRSVFFAIFRVMAYLTAAIVILFTLSLPFSVSTLFDNRNTSLILLSIVAISILLLNTLVDHNDDEQQKDSTAKQQLSPWRNRIFSLQIILLPFLSVLSVYAISLRISQYGLMPKRVIAIAVAILLSIYSVVYLYQLLTRKGKWALGLARVNPPLAVLWVVMLIVIASPLLDPVRLSVNNQVSRLQSEKLSVAAFDFEALKYRLGKRGKDALENMLVNNDHPKFTEIKQAIESLPAHCENLQASLKVIGEPPEALEELKNRIDSDRCSTHSPCYIKQLAMAGNGSKLWMVFIFAHNFLSAELYEYDKKWKLQKVYGNGLDYPPFFDPDTKPRKLDDQQKASIIELLKKNQEIFIKPKFMDLDLGVIKLRQ